MAKSKPIGVRFDLDKLEIIQKEQNLTSVQQVLNYLMDNYAKKPQEKQAETILLTPWGDRISSKGIKRGAPFKNMPPYNAEASKLADKPKVVQSTKSKEEAKNEPKEGSLAWFIKNS